VLRLVPYKDHILNILRLLSYKDYSIFRLVPYKKYWILKLVNYNDHSMYLTGTL